MNTTSKRHDWRHTMGKQQNGNKKAKRKRPPGPSTAPHREAACAVMRSCQCPGCRTHTGCRLDSQPDSASGKHELTRAHCFSRPYFRERRPCAGQPRSVSAVVPAASLAHPPALPPSCASWAGIAHHLNYARINSMFTRSKAHTQWTACTHETGALALGRKRSGEAGRQPPHPPPHPLQQKWSA